MGDSSCLYCSNKIEPKASILSCVQCKGAVHLNCLKRPGTPGGFLDDVFFNFTCLNCSSTGKEIFTRQKLSWTMIIIITIYNLSMKSIEISHHGFFHYKIHLSCFIDKNWNFLFTADYKKKKIWIGTMSGVLSTNPEIFVTAGSGWWKLKCNETPLYYYELLQTKGLKIKPTTKRILSDTSQDLVKRPKIIIKEKTNEGTEGEIRNGDSAQESNLDFLLDDESNINQFNLEDLPEISKNSQPISSSNQLDGEMDPRNIKLEIGESSEPSGTTQRPIKIEKSSECESDFEQDLNLLPTLLNTSQSRPLPWLEDKKAIRKEVNLVSISEPEEREMLIKLRNVIERDPGQSIPSNIRRFYRKLSVRELKRRKNKSFSNFDQNPTSIAESKINTLDRFQTFTSSCPINSESSFYSKLVGLVDEEPFVSPYVGRVLHPFIMRNRKSTPLWLKLMLDLRYKVNGQDPDRAPIDYCYVRPHHLSAVNTLLQTLFWPGIDMSECLTYPEFSVVALYKKLVIGCGFLVPDVNHNEAYISFMAVRPGWQRAGIATFMVYHLIQTCMGKDITLHVSATNPAVCLYQKFGFKTEEVILDFYEKYMDPSLPRDSKHALFLRLKS